MQMGMCVSACGSLVFACGEDGVLTAWDGHTGMLRGIYCGLLPPGSATVHYHPYEHMLAIASLAQSPTYILTFDRNALGEEVGLHIISTQVTAEDVIEKMKLIKNTSKWQRAASKAITNTTSSPALVHKNVATKEKKKKKGADKPESEKQTQSTNWPNISQLEQYMEKSSGDKDLRLLEIIRKMDSIILAAKQSSQS